MGKEGIEPPLRQSTLRIYSPRRPNQYSAFAHVLSYYFATLYATISQDRSTMSLRHSYDPALCGTRD